MAKTDKVIITCAVTGSIHTPTMSPHLPVTPDQIARDAVAAAGMMGHGAPRLIEDVGRVGAHDEQSEWGG